MSGTPELPRPPDLPARRPARILVVDDSRYHRELTREVLRDRAQVSCCENGERALEILARRPVDLVLSDLSMPGLSGLDLLERVRRQFPGTDFVLLTAHASVDSAVEALRRGATDYLQKPVRASDLILVVERTLARRGLVEENLRLREERSIFEACKRLAACLEPEDVFSVGLDLLLRSTGRRQGLAVYRRPTVLGSDGFHSRGFSEEEDAVLHRVLARSKSIDFERLVEVQRLLRGPFHDALRGVGVEAGELLVVPARGEAREVGVFCVLCGGEPFGTIPIGKAGIVAGHASVALRNAERYDRVRERAFVDDVTEIYNARYLLEALDREIRRAERYGTELSVLFLDLDRFKLVNDRHGHLVGSGALRQLSQVLGQCVRHVDTLARYGGDEFTILLVDTNEGTGLQVAERIRRTVEGHLFEGVPDQHLRLTCSLGVATYPRHGRTRETLLDAADKAMYRAKSNGRNAVCTASELG